MDVRNHEYYQVEFAHTEKMKDGPILFMQNLLNNQLHNYII